MKETKANKRVCQWIDKEVSVWECDFCHKTYDNSTAAYNCESQCKCKHDGNLVYFFSDDSLDFIEDGFNMSAQNLLIEVKCEECDRIIDKYSVPISQLINKGVIK